MKAWVLREHGLGGLFLVERETPKPGPHQVLVRVRASSLNFRDLLIVEGRYGMGQALPLIPGSDAAGEVVARGVGVTRVALGARVVGAFAQRWVAGPPVAETMYTTLGSARDGALAEYIVLDEAGAVAIPEPLSFEEAATLPVAGVTAWHALFGDAPVRAGDTVLVQGTGGVAVFAIQLARAAGARVIATSSSDDKLARARQLGAAETINYRRTPAWDERVRELTAGAGVDLVVDVAGGPELARSIAAVRRGGQVSLVGLVAGATAQIDILPLLGRNIRVQGIYVGSRDHLEALIRALVLHRIHPVIDRVYRFDQAGEAIAALGRGGHLGKLVIAGA